MAINCVIVDDEPIARDIVSDFCQYFPELKIVAICSNALEAKSALQQHRVDILFLDINMPVLSGLNFLKTLKDLPQVIFSTAHKKHATDAFDLAACDYLVKPFSLERFMIAVDRAIERMHLAADTETLVNKNISRDCFIRAEGKIFKVQFDEVLFVEARGNYIRIVTTAVELMPRMSFSSCQELFPLSEFIRVHRSFLINKASISHIEGNRIYIQKNEIPIGNEYREAFMKAIGI